MTRLERLRDALVVATTRPPVAMASTPLRLRNPLNGSGGTTKGARYATSSRRQKERVAGRRLARHTNPWDGNLPKDALCVVLTRISPKSFDDDNNAAALKSVRDGMAEAWGIDDADERVTWVCDWRKGPQHVVEAALWVVPAFVVTSTGGPARWVPAPSQPEFDASDYERPRRDAWADIRSDSRKPLALSPSLIRAKGGA